MEQRLATSYSSKETKTVDVFTQTRYQTPPVRLERKTISMLNPPQPSQQRPQDQDEPKNIPDKKQKTLPASVKGIYRIYQYFIGNSKK